MRYTFALIAALLLAACTQPPVKEQEGAKVEDRTATATTQPVEKTFEPLSIAGLTDPRSPLSKRGIYFDYDQYVVKDEFKPTIEAHAKFLVANPQFKVLIQGNADERGSREYNLALGQRRADALKKRLVLLGAQDAQIESVSLGEEKPVCTDQTEECYAKNRRGDMLYGGEY